MYDAAVHNTRDTELLHCSKDPSRKPPDFYDAVATFGGFAHAFFADQKILF
jgi:hypothetical protein